MSNLIDSGIEKSNMSMVWKFGILLLVFALLKRDRYAFRLHRSKSGHWIFRKPASGYVRQHADLCLFQHRPLFLYGIHRYPSDHGRYQRAECLPMLIKLAVRGPGHAHCFHDCFLPHQPSDFLYFPGDSTGTGRSACPDCPQGASCF